MAIKRLFVLTTLLSFSVALSAQNASPSYPPQELLDRIQADGIRKQMAYLADDKLEGRATGAPGFMLAAKYIADQFQQMGLKPGGVNGTYFQAVPFREYKLDRAKATLTIKRGTASQVLVFDKDWVAAGSVRYPETSIEAPVVFVGYGVTAPEFQYDDYAGIDVKGKIVAMLYGAPARFGSAPGAHYANSPTKQANAAAHGAVGTLSIWAGPVADRIPFAGLVRFYRSPSMDWLDSKGEPNEAPPQLHGSAMLNPETAAKMFEGAAKSFSDALATAKEGKPQAFPLPVTVALHMETAHTKLESPNIAAILPGSDPKLKEQYVVFSAHADHLGIGDPVSGDSIYNGALDNASGTAALIEIARAFSSMPTAPRRSMLFVAVTGEEEGLLGSDYFARYPTVPIESIIANVNMDEIGILYDYRDIVALGAEHSSIGPIVDDVAQHMKLEISPDPAPEEVYFVRSDQYSFVKQGVPSVYVGAGYKATDPAVDGKKLSDEWEQKYYHLPQDDMKQPNLHFDVAAKSARINLAVGYEIAQQDERPTWNNGDFFERFAQWWQMSGH